METIWGEPGHTVRWEVAHQLNRIRTIEPSVHSLIYTRVMQGKGRYRLSGDTHNKGWAVDISVEGLTAFNVVSIMEALDTVGFAAALRHKGEIAKGNPAHIHAAFRGQSNASLIDDVNGKGRTIGKMIQAWLEAERGDDD